MTRAHTLQETIRRFFIYETILVLAWVRFSHTRLTGKARDELNSWWNGYLPIVTESEPGVRCSDLGVQREIVLGKKWRGSVTITNMMAH